MTCMSRTPNCLNWAGWLAGGLGSWAGPFCLAVGEGGRNFLIFLGRKEGRKVKEELGR